MKILLVKSLPGFGDRMETLAMCVHFANEHKLQIYVDWTDPVWSEGFYKYFSLTNSLPVKYELSKFIVFISLSFEVLPPITTAISIVLFLLAVVTILNPDALIKPVFKPFAPG
jgi:hypothetical protein